MGNYDNVDKGVLFKNDRKENDKQPDYTGKINVSGIDYYINAWIRESKKNKKKFMSLAINPIENQDTPF